MRLGTHTRTLLLVVGLFIVLWALQAFLGLAAVVILAASADLGVTALRHRKMRENSPDP